MGVLRTHPICEPTDTRNFLFILTLTLVWEAYLTFKVMVIVRDENMETMRKVQCTLYIIVFLEILRHAFRKRENKCDEGTSNREN